ncbi:MAG TPA: lactate racemase domain-containing protein [Actinomycetota bacterium]|nr:lactate racemase domain-containing protein [Actinomycetota bacterium]
MRERIVFGEGWIDADLPDDTATLSPGVALPLPVADDLDAAYRDAVERPLDTAPLRELVRPGARVTVAFDDPTVPCYAPAWSAGMGAILDALARGGVRQDDVTLLCANALHRRFTHAELGGILGADVVRRFGDRLRCHDAEDPDRLVHLGTTARGHDVEVHRLVAESDLTVYLNCSTTRGFSGGWKSVCVGLSSYRSIRHHHDPDTMSMSLHRNRMHEILDEMGAVVEAALGAGRIFKVETVLANPLQVHRPFGGSVAATRAAALSLLRAHQPPRRTAADEPVDVVLYGVPDWSPYAAYSFTNPILTLISTGLGYLGGMIEAAGKPGCTVVMATPCPDRWDDEHHPSYREAWERVLPETRDPYEARRRFEPELARREDYVRRYRFGHAFHPVHAVMALYPLKRLRHAGRVIVAGADDPGIVRHAGFEPAGSVEEALGMARDEHGTSMRVGLVPYPPALSRR